MTATIAPDAGVDANDAADDIGVDGRVDGQPSDVRSESSGGQPPVDGAPVAPDRADAELRGRLVCRLVVVVVATFVCYHTSLWSLVRGLTVDTPLAYLGLVPFVAGGLGWFLSRPQRGELDIHDRHLDYIVGVPLIAVSLVALVVLPPRMGTVYWLYRIDLLTMPLFVAGAIALAFGVRMLWRVRAAVLFLFLAWPVPLRAVVTRMLEPTAELTAKGVGKLMSIVPLATPAKGDGITFQVEHGAGFLVTIASACSGANGLVGFLLVGGALALAMDGSRARKIAWLATGTALVWVFNLARIVAILAVGKFFGERAAIDILHPYVGLLSFNIAAVVMLLVVRRFGLRLKRRTGSRVATVGRAVPVARAAVALVVLVAVIGGWSNHGLTRYDPIASAAGGAKLLPFNFAAREIPGAKARVMTRFEHGKRFFGEDSTWTRWGYSPEVDDDGRILDPEGLRSNVPVLVDVINSSNAQSFSDFGIEACYRFHGFQTADVATLDLGHGLTGNLLRWTDANTGLKWASLYWIWPVRDGEGTRYERVVVLLNLDRNLQVRVPVLTQSVRDGLELSDEDAARAGMVVTSTRGAGEASATDADVNAFLAGYALDIVDTVVDRSEAMEAKHGGD